MHPLKGAERITPMRSRETRSSFSFSFSVAALLLATAAAAQGPVGNPPGPGDPVVRFLRGMEYRGSRNHAASGRKRDRLRRSLGEMSEKGLKLRSLRSWNEDGSRHFAGLFRAGIGNSLPLSRPHCRELGDGPRQSVFPRPPADRRRGPPGERPAYLLGPVGGRRRQRALARTTSPPPTSRCSGWRRRRSTTSSRSTPGGMAARCASAGS